MDKFSVDEYAQLDYGCKLHSLDLVELEDGSYAVWCTKCHGILSKKVDGKLDLPDVFFASQRALLVIEGEKVDE